MKKVDVTPNTNDQDVWSFTLEANGYRDTDYLNPMLDFSSRNGWDIQIASYSLPIIDNGTQGSAWDSYINVSKTFVINDVFKALIGSQNGTTLFTQTRQWHNFNYGLLIYQPFAALNVHAGPYWVNKALSSTTDTLGYTAGFSLDAIHNVLTVQADYFSGHSSVSSAIINVFYRIHPLTQMYCGVGVPETNSGNEFYGTLGVVFTTQTLDQ